MLLAFILALCLLGRRERRKQKAKGEGLQNSNAPGSWGLPENKIMMVIMIITVKTKNRHQGQPQRSPNKHSYFFCHRLSLKKCFIFSMFLGAAVGSG